MTRVLVVGGAGYIGSHILKTLHSAGFTPTTFDNLSTGHRDAVLYGDFRHGDLLDRESLARAFREHAYDAVMHFAACAYVGEAVADPRKYYTNNVIGSLNLVNTMVDFGVRTLIFSSTCATFGVPHRLPIDENHQQEPINPYGQTKLAVERMLRDYSEPYGLRSVALRYFNAAGASGDRRHRERHDPETHLIPLALRVAEAVRRGLDSKLQIYGDDYPTTDGTCVRDYVHVEDLCTAHLLALNRALNNPEIGAEAFNLGTGRGASVKEVIAAVSRVTGVEVPYEVSPRRPGDPPVLVAGADRARKVLGWGPSWVDIDDIIQSAWDAEKTSI